jgi:hypothetical protein
MVCSSVVMSVTIVCPSILHLWTRMAVRDSPCPIRRIDVADGLSLAPGRHPTRIHDAETGPGAGKSIAKKLKM